MCPRKSRMTKAQVNQFLQWFYSNGESGKPCHLETNTVIKMYLEEYGIVLTNQFVNEKRRNYTLSNGQIVRNQVAEPLTPFDNSEE